VVHAQQRARRLFSLPPVSIHSRDEYDQNAHAPLPPPWPVNQRRQAVTAASPHRNCSWKTSSPPLDNLVSPGTGTAGRAVTRLLATERERERARAWWKRLRSRAPARMERGSSWRLPAVVVGILVCAALFSPPAAALNIGIQSAGDGVVRTSTQDKSWLE
jgi:hypothetical protein